MITFNIPKHHIRAMLPFVSVDPSRAVLHSLKMELRPDKRTLLIATDGRRIAILRGELYGGTEKADVILEKSFLASALRVAKEKDTIIEIEADEKTIMARFHGEPVRIYTEENIPQKHAWVYPKWRAVVPSFTKMDGFRTRRHCVNGLLLADFAKAISILAPAHHGSLSMVSEGDTSPIIIRPSPTTGADFYGVLMPLRTSEDEETSAPDWLDLKET